MILATRYTKPGGMATSGKATGPTSTKERAFAAAKDYIARYPVPEVASRTGLIKGRWPATNYPTLTLPISAPDPMYKENPTKQDFIDNSINVMAWLPEVRLQPSQKLHATHGHL